MVSISELRQQVEAMGQWTQTLTVHIKWLREKTEKDPKKPEHIITVWGTGYRYE